ncbi:MAG: hypothetical protein K9G46_07295 [Flavobacteriales bacterium]|nr:hypothetical protein [Flavobacteriales bacterium]
MKKQEPKTDFNFSYADLEQLGDKADELMERDATELVNYGVDADYRDDVAAKTQALKDYPTDEELLGHVTEATEKKDIAADALRVSIRGMMVRVKQVFKPGSATYKGFGTASLDELTDSDLVRCGNRVVRLATEHLADLAPKGVTPAVIGLLGTAVTGLDDKIDVQDTAIRTRNESTQVRVEMANVLYDIIVELFDFGKDYWYTRNEAKYNDYIIYDTPGGGANPPTSSTFEGNVPAGTTVNVLSDVHAASVVEVTNNGTIDFLVCISTAMAVPCMMGTTVNPGKTVTLGGPSASPSSGSFLNITNNHPMIEAVYSVTVSG